MNAFALFSYGQEHIAYVKKIGLEDGLSSYSINDIVQDGRGIMWFATDYGLNQYDGTIVKSYTEESHGLAHNRILRIEEDINGNLWLWCGTLEGQNYHCIFDPISEKSYSIEAYTNHPAPFETQRTALNSGYKETLIFSEVADTTVTYYEYEGGRIKKVFSLIHGGVAQDYSNNGIKIDEDEYLVSRIKYLKAERYENSIERVKNGNIVESIKCDSSFEYCDYLYCDGREVWFPCFDLDRGTTQLTFVEYEKGRSATISINSLLKMGSMYHREKIYTLTSESVMVWNRNGEIEKQAKIDLALIDKERKLFIDKDENIWFHNDQYVYVIGILPQKFDLKLYSKKRQYKLRTVLPTGDGQMYLGGNHFFYQIKEGKVFSKLESIDKFSFMGAVEDPENDSLLWLGSAYTGLVRYNRYTNQMVNYLEDSKHVCPIYWKPHIDQKGGIWVGAAQGVYWLNQEKSLLEQFETTKDDAGLSKETVYHFYDNEQGTWLCTSNGVYLVDLQKKEVLNHYHTKGKEKSYLPVKGVLHLYEEEGIFWLATKTSGLVSWNPDTGACHKFTRYNAGLSHNTIYAVYGDNEGRIWMPSYRGIMSFDKESHLVNIYLTDDGLPHNEFNTIAHAKDKTGRLYFGSQNGLVVFHPDSIGRINKEPPFVIINATKKDKLTNELTSITNQILTEKVIYIQPNDKQIDLHFALLDYIKTAAIQYSYRIEDSDNDWNYQKESFIRITGLPNGRYQLKLRAKPSGSSDWIEYPDPIDIVVLPPFYLKWWFILLEVSLVVGVVFLFFRWRTKRLLERQEQLEEIVEQRTAKIAKQAKELKVLDEVKSNFFANISHELRTPLTLILGPLSYILDNPEKLEEEKVKEQLHTMQRNGKNLMELINEILDLTKLEANKLEVEEEPTPVQAFFEKMYRFFEPQFEKQKLVVNVVFELVTEDLTILMDRNKMGKIWNNFLSNALKFTPRGGEITIDIIEEEEQLILRVQDSGNGVHPDDLPYIFDRFYQSKQATQKLQGGTGIGLALVREFAQLLGGRVHAVSELGKGSTFIFELPKKKVNPQIMVVSDVIEEMKVDLIELPVDFTILIVEDNEDMRNFVNQLLAPKYNVLIAENGAEGLKVVEEKYEQIDLIISDIMMPEVDGLTLLKMIKSHEVWKRIPVIMLTALAAERDKLKALRIGVDDYLVKPFSVIELLVRVQNVLYNYYQRKLLEEAEPLVPIAGESLLDEEKETSQQEDVWLQEVEAVVIASISDQILSVEELSSKVFLSTRQLRRKMKLATGLTTHQFIREVQLRIARELLEEGNVLSVKEVAYRIGFDQAGTFSKLFKKRYGVSPSTYLK